METLLEHNPTKQELIALVDETELNEEIVKSVNLSQTQWYSLIYSLYMLRGDKKTACKYARMIPDTPDKIFGIMNHDFAI